MLVLLSAAVAAPLWFWLAARLRPATYIRMAAALVSISFALAFIALQVSQLFSMAVGLTAVTNLVTCPFLSLGMLGQEGVDVFKVRHCLGSRNVSVCDASAPINPELCGTALRQLMVWMAPGCVAYLSIVIKSSSTVHS
jgi:hypothetical protein